MRAFIPHENTSLLLLLSLLAIQFFLGYTLQQKARWRWSVPAAWFLALGIPLILDTIFHSEPAGFRMLAIITPLYFGMKAVVSAESARTHYALPMHRWAIFALLWPGMRPQLFNQHRRPLGGASRMAVDGVLRILCGAVLLYVAQAINDRGQVFFGSAATWISAAVMLVAISLIMHFGLFGVAAAILRKAGFDCRPLFRAPLHSRSLSEFWSRRWNLAFSEMISLAVHRPVTKRWGNTTGTLAAFGCSGVFHEMAISWPVHRGYGLPLTYFFIQAVFVMLESRLVLNPVSHKLLTCAVIIMPLPLLFHPWFLEDVVIPLL